MVNKDVYIYIDAHIAGPTSTGQKSCRLTWILCMSQTQLSSGLQLLLTAW